MKILARGDGFVAVDKPAGAVVIRDRFGREESLFDSLKREGGDLFLVHRLDRDTSGVLLFATSIEAQRELSRAFEAAEVRKEYVALCVGVPKEDEGRVAHPIAEGRKGRMVIREDGKPAATRWRVLERFPSDAALPAAFKGAEPIARDRGLSFLEARPETGRTHQIRVHLASLGLPITADPLYDFSGVPPATSRLALHARAIAFRLGGVEHRVESPLAGDIAAALAVLRR